MPQFQGGGSLVTSANIVNETIIDEDISASAAIAASKLSGLPYTKLAEVTLSGTDTALASGTITARKHLRVIIRVLSTSGELDTIQFNGDSGANYNTMSGLNGAGSSSTAGGTDIRLCVAALSTERYWILDIENVAAREKFLVGIGTAVSKSFEVGGNWTNSTDAITSITFRMHGGGNIDAGSQITVLGMD